MSRRPPSRQASRPVPRPLAPRLGLWMLWLLVLLVPVVLSPTAAESFRLPKLLLSECLGLASLLLLSWRLRAVERVDWRALLHQPVVLASLPVLAVATSGLSTTGHPLHVREGLVSLWIGAACLVGWSLALSAREHRALLRGMIVPATVLAALAVLQFHALFNPFQFEGRIDERIGITSLAGGAFDLAAYLVLPCLFAQLAVFGETIGGKTSRRRRWGWGLAGAVVVYAMIVSQTLAALAALAAGTVLLWLVLLPRRRVAAVVALVAVAGLASAVAIEPLRHRLERKLTSLRHGDLNQVLTGRLDGWRGALWMVRQEPWTGVGQGAYRAEFGNAKLALRREGVEFYRSQHQVYFTNAHSDVLDAAAEWGLPGVAALLWGLGLLLRSLRRVAAAGERLDVAPMVAGLAALAILALTNFPFHIALVAYPAILFLGWIFAAEREVRG